MSSEESVNIPEHCVNVPFCMGRFCAKISLEKAIIANNM